jgi:hypothetical protein
MRGIRIMKRENPAFDIIGDESRRSFLKKGALATSAVALGLSASGTAAAAPDQALVFGYEYNPGTSFQVVNPLQQGTVNSILGRSINGQTIVSNTDDYNGYVIRYQPDQNASEYAMVFSRGTFGQNETAEFGTNATFFNSAANLISADVSSVNGGGGGGGDDDE